MKRNMITTLTLLIFTIAVQGKFQQSIFDKSAFYKTLASENMAEINQHLSLLKFVTIPEKNAYEGVLLMRKAGIVKKAKEKLSLFKAGRVKLEAAIKSHAGNAEFHFLRLMIQEHAPSIVGYNKDIEKDCQFIRANYKNLPQVVQQAVIDYNKKSKKLKLQ